MSLKRERGITEREGMGNEVYMNGAHLAECTKSATGSIELPVGWR